MAFGWGLNSGFGFGPTLFPYTVPASRTEEGKKRLAAYYEALGRFVDMFARVETAITLTLWHYAKTPPEIAKVIFSGTKIDGGSQYIKQLAAAIQAPQSSQDVLADVLQQLGVINGVRNRILHYGATSVAEGNAIVSDALKAKAEATSFPISPTLLDQMTFDLRKIAAHLNQVHLGHPSEYTILSEPRTDAWRYKHPVPPTAQTKKAEGQPPPKRGPKQPRRQRPSRA